MAAIVQPKTWKPTRQNRAVVGEMTVMHGGPVAMSLPEHEHPEIQIGMHFVPAGLSQNRQMVSDLPNYFSLVPSGKPHVGGWGDGSEVVVTLLPRMQVQQAADELLRSSAWEIRSAPCAVDPVILSMGMVLRREFLGGGTIDPLYVEAVGTLLTGHIVRRWSSRPGQRSMKGNLTPVQLRRTLDAIEDCMSSGIRVTALAAQLGMGTHLFTRLFRQTIGCGPYRFVTRRRMERARALLEETSLSLVEIAYQLGFASQSHFTSTFHREIRTTPRSYRALFQKSK
jgi:AraC family transcriptional regulator